MKDDYSANSLTTSPINFSIKGLKNVLFELGCGRVKHGTRRRKVIGGNQNLHAQRAMLLIKRNSIPLYFNSFVSHS